ncbi:ADP-ribosylglycohydrolase family protein [Yimella sp. RIT 621]|uniref:ADP-ribosylglycohydrolase family protein n=1 Tax=Yimella sp. RIT 621 TaxID=2510323 RepID=UPI00145A0253|nr:ADP-ribosylglycohydrolase family protein [Yimella sp. RIT 621]
MTPTTTQRSTRSRRRSSTGGAHGASDIGNQTAAVLGAAESYAHVGARISDRSVDEPDYPWAMCLRKESDDYAAKHSRSAGNGALMRNGIVGLTRLRDLDATERAAVAVASLTHADPLVADSCVLHAEAIRVTVLEGRLDLRAGLNLVPQERRSQWEQWIDSADFTPGGRVAREGYRPSAIETTSTHVDHRGLANPAASIEANGSTFGALRAAWAAITSTDDGSSGHARRALIAAVRAGHDADTVAAITGALMGARCGVSGLPAA